MLVVKTYLKESPGKGIGLFAGESIQRGQKVWVYHPSMDLLFEEQDIPEGAEEFFAMYAVEYEPGKHAVHLDNARFINHSKDPNTRPTGGFEPSVAIRDIQEGEEITIDYEAIDVNAIDF